MPSLRMARRLAISVEHRAEHATDQTCRADVAESLVVLMAAVIRRRGENAVGETGERHRLQQYATRPLQSGEEEPFAAEQGRLDARHHLNVVVDTRVHRDDAAGVHAQPFTRLKIYLVHRARRVQERHANAIDALENEAFAAEEAGADAAGERDRHVRAARRAEERVLLRDDRSAPVAEIDGFDLAREMRQEGNVLTAIAGVRERRNEDRVARQRTKHTSEEAAHESTALPVRIERRVHHDD